MKDNMKINSNRWFLTLAQFSDFREILLLNKEIHLFKQKLKFLKKNTKRLLLYGLYVIELCLFILLLGTEEQYLQLQFTKMVVKYGFSSKLGLCWTMV